jgi:DNA-binding transcriptional MocR family regulator
MSQINFLRGVPADEALEPVADIFSQEFPRVFQKYGYRILQYQISGLNDFMGFNPLKKTLARRFKINGDPNKRIICTNGGMETFSFLLKSLPRGCQVATEALTYDRVLFDITRLGHKAIGVPLSLEGVDLEALQKTISKSKVVIFYQVAYHHSPTGITTSGETMEAASDLCSRHNVLHVLDIAYFELRYDGSCNELLDLAKFPNTTCLVGSFTKTLSPGAKCGFGVFPEKLTDELAPVIANTRLNPNFPTQAVIYNLIESGFYDNHLKFLANLYKPRMEAVNEAMRRHLSELVVPSLTGGFFIGFWLPGLKDESAFIHALKSKGVTVASAQVFAPGWRENYFKKYRGAFFRLTFPAHKPEAIKQGIGRIAETFKQMR